MNKLTINKKTQTNHGTTYTHETYSNTNPKTGETKTGVSRKDTHIPTYEEVKNIEKQIKKKENKMKKTIILFIALSFVSCVDDNFIISSKDGKHNISIITVRSTKTRYIINGTKASKRFYLIGEKGIIRDYDYVKISLDSMDLIADELIGYWESNGNWVVYNYKARVLENKLDTNKYKFYEKLPTKEFDVTTIEPILRNDFFRVCLSYYKIVSTSGNVR